MDDKLEFRWPTDGVEEPKRLASRIKDKARPHILEVVPIQRRASLDASFGLPGLADQLIEIDLNELALRASHNLNLRHEEKAEETFKKLDKNFGILSMSEISSDQQMWSHYADGGRGFLIEFDAQNSWFHAMRNPDDGFNDLTKVEYVSVRSAKNLLDIKDEVLYAKSDSWSHQQEWRIVRSFNDAKVKLKESDTYGNEISLFEIPPDAIKSAIIGFGAGPKLETEIRSVLASNGSLNHVVLKRATQSIETGQISIVPMKDTTAAD